MEFSEDCKLQIFCWRDLELLTDSFSEENFIANTKFCKVYRGKTQQGRHVTVKIWTQPQKVLRAIDCYATFCLTRLESECIFLTQPDIVNHPHFMNLIGYCSEVEDDHFDVVYDLQSKDTLLNLIDKDNFTWTQRMNVALGIANALKQLYIPNPPYVLQSLHPALIMLDQDSNPVLFDFYMLTGGALGDKQLVQSRYMVPFFYSWHVSDAYILSGIWDQKSDGFPFAIILLGLICKEAFNEEKFEDRIKRIPHTWALREYELKLNSGFQQIDCPLVHESLKGEPGFHAQDGVAMTKLALRPMITQIHQYVQSLQIFTGIIGEEGLLDKWDTELENAGMKKRGDKWKGWLRVCLDMLKTKTYC